MSKQVEFFFDFGSPYTYLAYHELRRIAETRGAQIVWRPILLGAAKPAHILTGSVTSRGVVNMTAIAVAEAATCPRA